MKLLVIVEVGADMRVPPQIEPRSGRIREEWLVSELEPASAGALATALRVKSVRPDVEVTIVHLGPADNERWLRRGLARGCDQAVRIWDSEAAQAGVAGKAVILAAAARVIGYDLVLSGTGGLLDPSGQLGVLLAQCLAVPCVTQVTEVDVPRGTAEPLDSASSGRVQFTRGLERGFRERVEAVLPLVAAVSAGTVPAGEASADAPSDYADRVSDGGEAGEGGDSPSSLNVPAAALLGASDREIPVWSLADLGVPLEQLRRADQPLRIGAPRPVRPRLHPLTAPDPALPAFERILELVEGTVERRAGRVIRKPAEEVVEEVFQAFRDEGWLDHLRPGNGP